MPIIKLLVILAFMFAAVPVESSSCHDEHCEKEVQQCAWACHVCCSHSSVIMTENVGITPPICSMELTRTILKIYHDPHLAVQHPPPIVLS